MPRTLHHSLLSFLYLQHRTKSQNLSLTMWGWPSLPQELRWMILDFILEDTSPKSELHVRKKYAAVCREWQFIFEKGTFQRITVDQNSLYDLDVIFRHKNRHRRDDLQHLCLQIKLAGYKCGYCKNEENSDTIRK